LILEEANTKRSPWPVAPFHRHQLQGRASSLGANDRHRRNPDQACSDDLQNTKEDFLVYVPHGSRGDRPVAPSRAISPKGFQSYFVNENALIFMLRLYSKWNAFVSTIWMM
jgi:hypothetical protein